MKGDDQTPRLRLYLDNAEAIDQLFRQALETKGTTAFTEFLDFLSRWADRRDQLTHGQRELEAEAVSWLVSRRLGLETRSAEYLSGYVSKDDLKYISTFAIIAAAHRVEAWRHA